MRNQGSSSGGMTPWLQRFALESLQASNDEESTSRPAFQAKWVQVLAWDGPFWQTQNPFDPAWMMVTDGSVTMVAYLSKACRQAIFQDSCCPPPPVASQAFLPYNRGSVGLIQDYELHAKISRQGSPHRPIFSQVPLAEWETIFESSNLPDNQVVLAIDAWKPQPSLNGMVTASISIDSIPSLITDIDVQQALQSGVVLGRLEDAMKDPIFMDEIFELAEQAMEVNETLEGPAATTNVPTETEKEPAAPESTSQDPIATQDDEEEEGDEDIMELAILP